MGKYFKGKIPVQNRIAVYSIAFFLIYTIFAVANVVSENNIGDNVSSPMGVDYIVLYTSGRMAASGHAIDIYKAEKARELAQKLTGVILPKDVQWFYLPTSLLAIVSLLSYIPFYISLLVWIAVTFAAAALALYLLVPKQRILSLLAFGFPGVMLNIRWGQTGFLNTALLGAGLYFMQSNPILAGLIFGMLSYKPQFLLFPFLILLISKEWRTLTWSVLFGLATIVISFMFLGADIWIMFFHHFYTAFPALLGSIWRTTIKIQPTLYTSLRLFGLNGYWLDGILALFGIFVTLMSAWVYNRTDRVALKGSVLILGIFAVMPYFIQYDLMILCIPFVLIAYDFLENGCRKYELIILASLWMAVLLNMFIVIFTRIQILPYVVILNIAMAAVRVKNSVVYQSAKDIRATAITAK